jgi:hypothetical protein
MENNIFVKMSNKKYNPDIEHKTTNKQKEREQMEFEKLKVIYNPITNVIPTEIKKSNDLLLEKDTPFNNNEINNIINNKNKEREEQNKLCIKNDIKVIDNIYIQKNTNMNNIASEYSKTNYIETHDEMKNQVKKPINNTGEYNHIMEQLKKLGILN